MNSGNLYIGVDLGGSFIKIGYGSFTKGLIFFNQIPSNSNQGRDSLLLQIDRSVNKCIASIPKGTTVKALGFGSPGIVDRKTGKILGNCPNIKGWEGSNPKEYLQNSLSIPVYIENDADLMTYGESLNYNSDGMDKTLCLSPSPHEKESKSVLGITIGTGIGCGFVTNGSIMNNRRSAMELGHCIIIPSGHQCLCGKKGCAEAYSSVRSILTCFEEATGKTITLDEALSLYQQNPDTPNSSNLYNLTTDCFPEHPSLTTKSTVSSIGFVNIGCGFSGQLNGQDEQIIVSIINRAYTVLGIAIANAVTLLSPDIVLIGGGITESKYFDIEPLANTIKAHLNEPFLSNCTIRTARLKNKSAVWGGIVLAEKQSQNI